jgi:hypothetical protein
MRDRQVTYELLRAAIKHARENAHGPTDRRSCAIFFLQCLQQDYIRGRQYVFADIVRNLIRRANATKHLTSLLETVAHEAGHSDDRRVDPVSNTGPTERLLPETDGASEQSDLRTFEQLAAFVEGHARG